MRRRTMLAAGLAALPLAGCAGGRGEGRRVFRQFDPADQATGLAKAVKAWNTEHPDYTVTMETLSPNNPQQFAREANAGSGPDIAQLAFTDVSFMAEPRILTPLDRLMSSAPAEGQEDLLATDMTTYDRQSWAIPWTADTMALVFRPDVLEKSGVADTPEDWEELAEVSARITKDSGGDVSGFVFPAAAQYSSAQWFPINYYLWAHGSQLIRADGESWEVAVDEQQLADAMTYFNTFFTERITPAAMQAVTDYGDPSIVGALGEGSCAMTFMPPTAFRAARESIDAELMTAPMPCGLVDGATHLGGRALGINANCEEPEAAWAFVSHLLSPETFELYPQYPASAATLDRVDVDPSERGFTKQLPHAESFARYADAPITIASLQEQVNQQFSAVYSGQSEPEDASHKLLDALARGLEE
ncbi:extracellular solute-binding protein [Brachybacterium sp. MASK1Z-5]|uniref:Extracellular solute-binding protein n=1 Tax=Brachybacterium halotolerans TaxID=2795215 RepID=A0ABS1BA38_9MICO|nr:extracellular solute-binding protein [Brachybacterium halotolerans]MBK0331496.1 extracellular solute-binding protein [Brachybacterium halotolerans]